MYTPRLFHETDPERAFDLIAAYSFGMLLVPGDGGEIEIAHLPFLVDRAGGPHGTLRCHVARANPIWQLARERPVTAVFTGPHGYISPRWYERPSEQVPTWNYAVVHAHGRARTPLPEAELRTLLADLSAVHERGAAEPWSLDAMVPGLADDLMGAIVGLSITVERLESKFKLSQNRSAPDRARVRSALSERGSPADLEMLRWMPPEET